MQTNSDRHQIHGCRGRGAGWWGTGGRGRIITGNKKNLGQDWYVHYLDYGVGFTGIYRGRNFLNCLLWICATYRISIMHVIFYNHKALKTYLNKPKEITKVVKISVAIWVKPPVTSFTHRWAFQDRPFHTHVCKPNHSNLQRVLWPKRSLCSTFFFKILFIYF